MQNQSNSRLWSKEEDDKLRRVMTNGTVKPNWKTVTKESGLKRTANSCRRRWVNHLKPGLRPDCKFTDEEKLLILEFRFQYGGNRWAKIAKNLLPGRRDNDVKNYWHSLAKRAKREGRDVDVDAFRKREKLVKTIKAAGKFTMDYSSSIRAVAFEKLKELLPGLAGGGAVAEAAASSAFTGGAVSSAGISNDLASSSAATDIGAADGVTSWYSAEFGPGRVGNSDFSKIGPTAEVDPVIRFNPSNPTEISNPEELISSGLVDHGGGATGFIPVPAAAAFGNTSTEISNQGWRQMQVTSSDCVPAWNTSDDAPQFPAPAEQQHQQLGFSSDGFYLGGGAAEFNQATAAAFPNMMQFYFY